MTKTHPPGPNNKETHKQTEEKRRGDALRANLHRRKAQSRGRADRAENQETKQGQESDGERGGESGGKRGNHG